MVFEIRAFQVASYFSKKAHEPLNQNKRSKNQLWVWCHCNLSTFSGLCLFCNSSHLKSPFPDIFDELLFICASLFSPKSVSLSHHRTRVLKFLNQISLKVVSATFLLVCFVCLNDRTCETRKNVYYFTSKTLSVLEIIKF